MSNATNSSVTLRRFFALPEAGAKAQAPDRWQAFQARMTKEVRGIKWKASMPDVVAKIAELFDVEIPGLFITSWKKTNEIGTALEETRRAPDEVRYVGLADHSISSELRPYIDVRIENATVKRIEFTAKLTFTLKGFVLKIQRGEITEIGTGRCEGAGTISFEGLPIAEKKMEPINLPGSIVVQEISGDPGERKQLPSA